MPTAAFEGGRPRSGARPASRGDGAANRPPTKLRAAYALGLSAPVVGAAAVLLASLILAAGLATGGRGRDVLGIGQVAAANTAKAVVSAPVFLEAGLENLGWRVSAVRLQGATAAAEPEILAAAAVRPGQSLTRLDLAAVRERVENVGWVAQAQVIRLLPNTLEIAVVQRPLMAVWQHQGRTVVVAANGAVEGAVDPARFQALPLIVGAGANRAAAEFLPFLSSRPALMTKIRALVRVDDRRWNLLLRDGAVVLLPAQGEDAALARLDGLQSQAKVLDLGLARIDLRDPEMVVLRPRGASAPVATKGGV